MTSLKYLSKLDGFGEAFGFNLDRETKTLKSGCGAIGTLFMGIVVLTYAYLRADVFLKKSSMDVLQTLEYQQLTD